MNYCNIDEDQKKHLLKLIDWIYNEVINSGGDGDCLWYSKFYDVKDILILVNEYNNNLKYKWEVEYNESKQSIFWYRGQESACITNNEEFYKSAPSWSQCIIIN